MTPAAGTDRRIPALDGVRGFAVLLVIAFHSRRIFATTAEIPLPLFRFLGLGWSGVDLFFVLSGFLITGILLDTRQSPGYFRTFYIRRVLRIFPLYFAYLFLVLVVAQCAWLRWTGADPWVAVNPLWFLTYLMNWSPGHGLGAPYLEHLWSLAIEEQFYLVWPAVVWLVPRRNLKWVCLTVAITACLCRLAWPAGADTEVLYRLTTSRMDGMALGALAALGLRDFPDRLLYWSRLLLPACALAFLVIGMLCPGNVWSDAPMRLGGASLVVIAYAGLVGLTASAQSGALSRCFSWSWLRTCGKYSYAMYVFHWPLCLMFLALWKGPFAGLNKYVLLPLLAASSLLVARLSWVLLESRLLRWKARFSYGPSLPYAGSHGQTTSALRAEQRFVGRHV